MKNTVHEYEYANLQNAKNQLALLEQQCGKSKVRLAATAQKRAHLRAVIDMLDKNIQKKVFVK